MSTARSVRTRDGSRVPPHNLDAEKSLLGAMLLSRDAIAAVNMRLGAEDFYQPAHGHVYGAVCSLYGQGEPVDPVTVAEELRRAGLLDAVGGAAALISLQAGTPATGNAVRYARIVKEHAVMRWLIAKGGEIAEIGYDMPDDVDAAVDRAMALVQEAAVHRRGRDVLVVEDAATVAARVAAAPQPRYLAAPVLPAEAYAVLSAESKAGKTWAMLDLAVGVASGGAWLGAYRCEDPGPVLMFLGEGGERKMMRRLEAVCAHYGVDLDGLPLRLCFRAPQLASREHLARIGAELSRHPARLVTLDPLYLAAGGANGSSLYEMGELLRPAQELCQEHGAALAIAHHWNKTGSGRGRDRATGAGTAEWGRLTVSIAVERRTTEVDGTSDVVLAWQFVGDEMPDDCVRVRRRVRADDPRDLASPLRYSVELLVDVPAETPAGADPVAIERPAVQRVWTALLELGRPANVHDLGDRLAIVGPGLKQRTIQDALARLRDLGIADGEPDGSGRGGYLWSAHAPAEAEGAAEERESGRAKAPEEGGA